MICLCWREVATAWIAVGQLAVTVSVSVSSHAGTLRWPGILNHVLVFVQENPGNPKESQIMNV